MKDYSVGPSNPVDIMSFPTTELRKKALKNALKDLQDIVDDFAMKNPGTITIGESMWINTTVEIKTRSKDPVHSAKILDKLAKTPGIGEIREVQTVDLTNLMDKNEKHLPRRKRKGPSF